jgi:hypothetical protein
LRVALFFSLGGDIDILASICGAVLRAEHRARILVADTLLASNARFPIMMDWLGVSEHTILSVAMDDTALISSLAGCDALVTATETTLRPHAFAHRTTNLANAARIPTFTSQHGVENVGLTYFDERQGVDVLFASRTLLTWSDPAALPQIVDPATRAKCIGVGYSPPPTEVFDDVLDRLMVARGRRNLVGVFENLHWTRFSESYRGRFLADLQTACQRRRDLTFIFKPHPEGKWLTRRFLGEKPIEPNLIVADPDNADWSLITAPTLVRRLAAVVTTPSKTALDASVAGVPVAIASYDGVFAPYVDLPSLSCGEDWLSFLDLAIADPTSFRTMLERFRSAVAGAGQGAEDAVKAIAQQAAAAPAS